MSETLSSTENAPHVVFYERIESDKLQAAIRLRDGEHLLVLQPFGWHLDGKHMPNVSEHFSLEHVCEDRQLRVVDELGGCIAIVRDARPLWHQVADVNTDNGFEAELRALVQRVEIEGGASELMTAVVTALGKARDELKTRRLR